MPMPNQVARPVHVTLAGLLLSALIAGCAGTGVRQPAPVEDRASPRATPIRTSPTVSPAAPDTPAKPLPGIENLGKPGYYQVKGGDTVMRIALEHGQPWRDIVRWNQLDNANLIEVGQVLRVAPPGMDPGVVATRPVTTAGAESRPLASGVAVPPATNSTTPSAPAASAHAATAPGPTAAEKTTAASAVGDEDVQWSWPTTNPVSQGFDDARNKGLLFNGKAGDPVLAAADGKVVYAGDKLRGYGNLIIVKHSANWLSAYAHNREILVKEEQQVKRGQKIAEMGSTDAERVQLLFEIRRTGKPQDPARLLPSR